VTISDSPQEAAIRTEARAWLETNWPPFKKEHGITGRPPFALEVARAWHRRLDEAGWGAPAWPEELGGRGFGPVEAAIWSQEKARAGAAITFNIVGFGMAGPTIVAHGTQEQKDRHLQAIRRGDEIWCQLFSEPGAGSDLASLQTKATIDGDSWVIDGQKVWSSDAHVADFGLLLARSDPDVPKHAGLTYFLLDMRAPGVDVRPLRQLSGDAHFSEVFLSGVRIPDDARIGEPGEGWAVARTTLLYERMSLGDVTAGITFPFERLTKIARDRNKLDALTRQRLVEIYARERLLAMLNARMLSKLSKGEIPTVEGSVLKLMLASLGTQAATEGVRLLGGEGTLLDDDGPQLNFLWERAMHIGGGTDEVQRNQIAERVLGLPRDAR
jgi:alkylation response protein AidB-like acyl-CoA dehydrogenase